RRRLALVASYAYTRATTRAPGSPADGLRTPSIPEHDGYGRLEATLGPVTAWGELSYVSGVYFDDANLSAAPPRVLLGAAVSVTPPVARWLTVTVLGTNLLDQREGVVTAYSG